MQLVDWIPAVSTTSLLALVLWLAQSVISTRLTKTVEHEFATKLEGLRTSQRKVEEELRADIRAREAQLSSLQSGALAAMLSRQQALDKRRLEAVDQVWAAVQNLAPARVVATAMLLVDFENAAVQTQRDPQARQLFEMLGQGFDPKELDVSMAHQARPFLSPIVWATYSAYSTLCMHGVVQQLALKSGVSANVVKDSSVVSDLVVAVLPHYKAFIEEHGTLAYYHVFPALEEKLIAGLQGMLRGTDGDATTIAQAAAIVQLAEAVQRADTSAGQST